MAKMTIDLQDATLGEFQDFVFAHEVHPIGSDQTWYHQFDLTIRYDANRNAALLTQLFMDAGSLLDKYEKSQLEQGFWAMVGSGFDGNVNELIWESSISVIAKEKLISSMYYLYRDLFLLEPLGEACEMWWDGLAYEINPMRRVDTVNNVEHRKVQNAMFETLTKILQTDQSHCQFAALHGLNHVYHPDTGNLIKSFVESRPDLTDREVEYATACANGTAM